MYAETTTKDRVYEILKEATADETLREIAEAVEAARIPAEAVNDLFALKLLFNTHLFTGWDNIADVASKTARQGLFRRPLGEPREKKREKEKRTVGNGSVAFRNALAIARKAFSDVPSDLFADAVDAGVAAYQRAVRPAKEMLKRGRSIETVVETVLDERAKEEGDSIALVPIDRYLAAALAAMPYEANRSALAAAARHVETNLRLPEKPGCDAISKWRLPVGRGFKDACLGGGFEYSEEFFKYHAASVWNDMLTCWAFSMAGRVVDVKAAATSLLTDLAGTIEGDLGRKFANAANGREAACVFREGGEGKFGYATAVFVPCAVGVAKALAVPTVAHRVGSAKHKTTKFDAMARLLQWDLLVHGISVSNVEKPSALWGFAGLFGSLSL